jgi:hypothetical protein
MREVRAAGKHVILAGDLNMRARAVDTSPSQRIVNIDAILSGGRLCV